jgi:hypothetical protein
MKNNINILIKRLFFFFCLVYIGFSFWAQP